MFTFEINIARLWRNMSWDEEPYNWNRHKKNDYDFEDGQLPLWRWHIAIMKADSCHYEHG